MLTVINSPTKYNFSRNHNWVEISTDNYSYNVNIGTKAVGYFYNLGGANPSINDILEIKWPGNTVTYTYKAAYNIGAKEIGIPDLLLTEKENVITLANALLTDPDVANYFDIGAWEGNLFFEAKLPGTAFDLAASNTNSGAGFNNYAPVDVFETLDRPNYKIITELQVYEDGDWVSVVTIGKEPVNGKVSFDLAKYIDSYLEYDLPNMGLVFFHPSFACTKSLKEFRVKISESYGDVPEEVSTGLTGMSTSGLDGFKHVSAPYKVLKAGFDPISARIKPDNQFAYYAGFNGFLTNMDRTQYFSRNLNLLFHPFFLHFMFHSAPASTASLRSKGYDKAGNMVFNGLALTTDPGVQINDVWCFPLWFGYGTDPAIHKMEVYVEDNTTGDPLSETFTFIEDEKVYIEETNIFFSSSHSGSDTLRCFGARESKPQFEREVAERTPTVNDSRYEGDRSQLSVIKNNTFTVFSGWKTKKELLYVEDLFLSKNAWTWINRYGQQIETPIIITNKEYIQDRTNTNLSGYIIEYEEALSSEITQANFIPVNF